MTSAPREEPGVPRWVDPARALAVGVLGAVLLAVTVEHLGATPVALVPPLALAWASAVAGASAARRWSAAQRRALALPGPLVAWAVVALDFRLGAVAGPSDPAMVWAVACALLGGSLGVAGALPRARPAGLALCGLAVATVPHIPGAPGWLGGLPALALATTLAAAAGLATPPPPPPGDWRRLQVPVAAGLAVLGWNAGRAAVDPSPGGLALAMGATLLLAAPVSALPGRPSWASAAGAALALLLLLGTLPGQLATGLVPLAGQVDPRWALAAAGAALMLPAAWVLGRGLGTPGEPAPLSDALAAVLGAGVAVAALDAGPRTFAVLVGGAGVASTLTYVTGQGRVAGTVTLVGAIAAALAPAPWPDQRLPDGLWTHLRRPSDPGLFVDLATTSVRVSGGWGPGGAILVHRRPDDGLWFQVDGQMVEPGSRAVSSMHLAAHLGSALAPRTEEVLVLGDPTGEVVRALAVHRPLVVRMAVPHPEALRAVAAADPPLADQLLSPSVALQRQTPELAVRRSPPQDLVVEVVRGPWVDGHQGPPAPRQLRARARLVDPRGGVWVGVIGLEGLQAAELGRLLADVAEAFPYAAAFLPPMGADQILVAGWTGAERVPWDGFLAAYGRAAPDLATLGIRSALDLADRAMLDRPAMAAEGGDGPSARRLTLPAGLHRTPRLILAGYSDRLVSAAGWIDAGPAVGVPDQLVQRLETWRRTLELLDAAARGAMDDVFEQGRALSALESGTRALDPLVAPYLDRARTLVARANAEGPTSQSWLRAQEQLAAARLIHPSSTEVRVLLGEVYLGLGRVNDAQQELEAALHAEPGRLEALHGLARLAVLAGEPGRAEALLRRAWRANPRSWLAAHRLGEALRLNGKAEEATVLLRDAVELSGGEEAAPHGSLALAWLALGEPVKALPYAETAFSLAQTAELRTIRGQVRYDLGQLELAAEDFQRAALDDPRAWVPRYGLALVAASQRDWARCVQSGKLAAEFEPRAVEAQEVVARCGKELELRGGG